MVDAIPLRVSYNRFGNTGNRRILSMETAMQKFRDMEKSWKWYQINRFFGALAGAVVYSLGINLFIVPVALYSGGIMGFSQILRTILIPVSYTHLCASAGGPGFRHPHRKNSGPGYPAPPGCFHGYKPPVKRIPLPGCRQNNCRDRNRRYPDNRFPFHPSLRGNAPLHYNIS